MFNTKWWIHVYNEQRKYTDFLSAHRKVWFYNTDGICEYNLFAKFKGQNMDNYNHIVLFLNNKI